MKKKSRLVRSIINLSWRILMLVTFFAVSSVIVIYARGYQINLTEHKIEATGAVSIAGNQSGLSITINGELVGTKLPYFQSSMPVNTKYNITIAKTGFESWSREVTLEPERIVSYGFVRLFPTSNVALPSVSVDKKSVCANNLPDKFSALSVNGGEILMGETLILRSSAPVIDTCWFNDKNHIAYISDGSVWVTDSEGKNTTRILADVKNATQVVVLSSNKAIYFQDNLDKWYQIELAQ
jgi:hypothetical protein